MGNGDHVFPDLIDPTVVDENMALEPELAPGDHSVADGVGRWGTLPDWAETVLAKRPKQVFLINGHPQRPYVSSTRGMTWELGTRAFGCLQRERCHAHTLTGLLEVWAAYRLDRKKGDEEFMDRMEALEREIEEEIGG